MFRNLFVTFFVADIRMLTLWGHRSKQAHVTHEIKYVQVARLLLTSLMLGTGLSVHFQI